MTKQDVLEKAKELSRQDLIDVALDIWDAVDAEPGDFPLSAALRAELDDRIKADASDRSPAHDWEILRDELLRGEL